MRAILVGGFLGCGKTTLINKWLSKIDKKYCIVENEYGSVNLDKDYFIDKTELLYDIHGGCVCCDSKIKFEETLNLISQEKDIEYCIIEPTGIADLNELREIITKFFSVTVITIVDGLNYEKYMKNFPEFYSKQILDADEVYVNRGHLDGFKNYMPDFCEVLNLENKLIEYKESIGFKINIQTLKNLSFNNKDDFEKFIYNLDKKHVLLRAKGEIKIDNKNFRFNFSGREITYDDSLSNEMVSVFFTKEKMINVGNNSGRRILRFR